MDTINLIMASLPSLFSGLLVTLKITAISLLFASIIGLITGLINIGHNKILKVLATIYIDIVRGTPIIVQAFFIYFGLPGALNMKIEAVVAGVIVVSFNAGAYMSEIFRAGILAVDIGQMEAAKSLGLPYSKAMLKVILPQAVKKMIPAIINQFIISLKDTSILTVIGIRELTQSGEIIVASTYKTFEIWGTVAIMYFVVIYIIATISRKIERVLAI